MPLVEQRLIDEGREFARDIGTVRKLLDHQHQRQARLGINTIASSARATQPLFGTAKAAGVTKFGLFNDAGYKGLYAMLLKEVETHKGVRKGELPDRAGSTELAANLFRVTQPDEKLKKDNVRGQQMASRVHNMVSGKVRQIIKDIVGILPENLKPESHIRALEQTIKLQK